MLLGYCLSTADIAETSVSPSTFWLESLLLREGVVVRLVNAMGMSPLLHFLCCGFLHQKQCDVVKGMKLW